MQSNRFIFSNFPKRRRFCLRLIAGTCFSCSGLFGFSDQAKADDGQNISHSTVDREPSAHTLHRIGSIHQHAVLSEWKEVLNPVFDVGSDRQMIPLDSVLQYGGRKVAFRSPLLLMTDGSWISGIPKKVTRYEVAWDSKLWGPMRIPFGMVRGLILRPPGGTTPWNELHEQMQQARDSSDSLWMMAGERRSGVLQELDSDGTLIDFESDEPRLSLAHAPARQEISVDTIQALVFSPALSPMLPDESNQWEMAFQDGDRIRCQQILFDQRDQVHLELALPIALQSELQRSSLLARLAGLRQLHPTGVRWLDREAPASFRRLPQWSKLQWPELQWPELQSSNSQEFETQDLQRFADRNRSPRTIDRHVFDHGLSMLSSSQASFRLKDHSKRFLAELAVPQMADGESGIEASLIAKVLVHRHGRLETAYQSPVLRSGDHSAVDIDLDGCKLLVLLIDPSERGEIRDEVVWINARILENSEGEAR